MAGRKRKIKNLTAAVTQPEPGLLNRNRKRTFLPDSPKEPIKCEITESLEPEQSHYFNQKNDLPRKLGQEFFNQPCISLAKAFLGKVLHLYTCFYTEEVGLLINSIYNK